MAVYPPRCRRPDGSTKSTFRSPAKAPQAIKKQRVMAGIPLYAYQCPKCRLWHITSQSQEGRP